MVGAILPFAGSVIPEGFLLCDGRAVSRETYGNLFYEIGTSYGAGDGSTTFNLPDMVNRVPVCDGSGLQLGSMGGEESHVLIGSELPGHTHSIPAHGHGNDIQATTPTMAHTVTQAVFKYSSYGTGNAGSGSAGTYGCYSAYGSSNMSRSANLVVAGHAAAACTKSGGIADCAAFDTEDAGQGQAHNNMMPFLALAYIIQAESDTPPVPSMALIHNGTVIPVTAGGAYIAGRK